MNNCHTLIAILFIAFLSLPGQSFACAQQQASTPQVKAQSVSTKTWAKNASKQEKMKVQAAQNKKDVVAPQTINLATEPTSPSAK